MTKRIRSHVLEKVIGVLMAIFGISAIIVFIQAMTNNSATQEVAMIEILLILVIAILAQTIVLIRIYEQHEEEAPLPVVKK